MRDMKGRLWCGDFTTGEPLDDYQRVDWRNAKARHTLLLTDGRKAPLLPPGEIEALLSLLTRVLAADSDIPVAPEVTHGIRGWLEMNFE